MSSKKLFPRFLNIKLPAGQSAFLWGARKTGKTTLLRQQFANAFWIDLLDFDLFLRLSQNPKELRQMIDTQAKKTIVIDEVQKIPQLMDEIHWLIENKHYQFLLSGSSARKLKRGNTGLLGGRAWRYELFPLVSKEIGSQLNLSKALCSGFIPAHYLSSDFHMDLQAYITDYLKEEIQAEALTRNLPAFSLFLKSAALTNGMLLNYSNTAREAGVSAKIIREYYQILEDTLIGKRLLPWKQSKKRRLIDTAKFYFFDVGIVSGLLNYRSLTPGTNEYGRAFEHFILQECWAYNHYSRKNLELSFWRTANGAEVDLIIGDGEAAIEIKSSNHAGERTKGLHLFSQEAKCRQYFIVSRDPFPRKLQNGFQIIPWQQFCTRLWQGDIF
jgi:predicted AAA+ superfamily ATPase